MIVLSHVSRDKLSLLRDRELANPPRVMLR